MTYRLDLDEVRQTIALEALVPAVGDMELPRTDSLGGSPWRAFNPDGVVRFVVFGEGRGTIIYLVLEDQQIVDFLEILLGVGGPAAVRQQRDSLITPALWISR